MRAIDIANLFIVRHGRDAVLSNLSLNKLVYYAQAESLHTNGRSLFSDPIEAWAYGPVEPTVYHAFKYLGYRRAVEPREAAPTDRIAEDVVDQTFSIYGSMTAFDLVDFSHRDGSAWKEVYKEGENVEITPSDILASQDGVKRPPRDSVLTAGLGGIDKQWSNTFRLLRNA